MSKRDRIAKQIEEIIARGYYDVSRATLCRIAGKADQVDYLAASRSVRAGLRSAGWDRPTTPVLPSSRQARPCTAGTAGRSSCCRDYRCPPAGPP